MRKIYAVRYAVRQCFLLDCFSMLFYAVRLCAAMLFCYAGIQSKSMRFNGIQRRPMQSIGVRV